MKTVKLNESQLIDIVKNIIKEQHEKQYMLRIEWKNTPNIAKEKNDFFSVGNDVQYIPKDPNQPVRDTTVIGPYTEEEYQTYKWMGHEMEDEKFVKFLDEKGITLRDVNKRTWLDATAEDLKNKDIPSLTNAGQVPPLEGTNVTRRINKLIKQMDSEIAMTEKNSKEYWLLVGRKNGYNHVLQIIENPED
jgi:hypothetical protein